MVSKELQQLLSGSQGYQRERAPEPLLLPRLATRIAPEHLGFVAHTAKIMSLRWAPYPWPALGDAIAQLIASRHMELEDNLLSEVLDSLPQLPLALFRFGEEAQRRVATLVGGDAANLIRTGLGSPEFILREAVKRVFDVPDPPASLDELAALIREQIDAEYPEKQRILAAYLLPLTAMRHRPWMLQVLTGASGMSPGWCTAAMASRLAGLLDQAAAAQIVATLDPYNAYWADHVRGLLAGEPAGSVFLEVTRALPCDGHLESLLEDETEPDSLMGFVDGILQGWGGAPPAQMAEPGEMEHIDTGEHDGAEPAGIPASRGFEFEDAGHDDGSEEALPEPLDWSGAPPPPAAVPDPLTNPAAAPVVAPAPAPQPQSQPERRVQAQVFADDGGVLLPVSQGFMKGARHDVRLWIGPRAKHAISADDVIKEPVPDDREQLAGSMEIVMTLVHGSTLEARQVDLPVDRAKPSKAAVFSLDVEQEALFVSAEIWLQHKGRVFQYLKLNGLALDEPDSTSEGIALKVESLVRGLPENASASDFGMAVVKKDNRYIVFGPRGAEKTEVSLQGARDVVEQINKKLFNATKGLVRHTADNRGTSWVKDHDEEAMQLLREMARWGNALYDTLKKEGALERISETIQFVNLDESDIVPIEYVYDRGYPKDGATLCDGFKDAEDWNKVFATGKCSCANQPLQESDSLCPMGFWSLSKIIERQPRPRDAGGTASATGFTAPSGTGPGIALSRHALLATAPNVNGLDVESIKTLLEETYPNRHKFALDWQEWKTEIREKSPKLLILLPHHGQASQGHTDFLEIGNPGQVPGRKLYAGLLQADFVTDKPDEPGPIVLLLGCETAQSDLLPFHTFARDFLAQRASLVVATQSSVLGQHAAPVANEFIRQLLASSHAQGSFGRIMRDVRRRMFAAGYLMSLALVSFGDSDWKLENGAQGDNHV